MKKILVMLALALTSYNAMADDFTPVQKHRVITNSFWSNWFIQGGVSWDSWYSNQEHGMDLKRNPFSKFRSNQSVTIGVGKWFTPGLGIRTTLNGIWGKNVEDGENHGNHNKYWTLNGHGLFNVSNMLCGYNPSRVYSFIPFVGGGITRSMSTNLYAMQLSFGILNQFKVSKRTSLDLEIGWNRMEGDADGHDYYYAGRTGRHRGWDTHDNRLYAQVGFTVNLGRTGFDKVPDVDALKAMTQSQLDALNAQLQDANAENDRLKKMLDEAQKEDKTPQAVKEFITTPVSVFFELDKSVIASQKDYVNIAALAKYAKENNSKVLVKGYADSATGKPAHNLGLSQRRAQAVVNQLVKLGVNADNITAEGKGGVNDLSPISFNRRATVQIVIE